MRFLDIAVCVLMLVIYASNIVVPPLPHLSSSIVSSQTLQPAGSLQELAIDDGVAECIKGPPASLKATPGFGWANKLTPASYPATLRTITIAFNRNESTGREVKRDSLYRIVVFLDPEMNGPNDNQQPAAAFTGRVRGTEQFMTFNLVVPLTISSGSFVIGAIDQFAIANSPALVDTSVKPAPSGSESFVTLDGGAHWVTLINATGLEPACPPGNFLIRATVEYGSTEFSTVTKVKDPQAVEPWSVGFDAIASKVFVTNYASDNVTVIGRDNTIQNIAVGDGPGGTPDGPFGVVGGEYVTLFGSNEIPRKGIPIDYSKVGPGRVQVLRENPDGTYAPLTQISVGKGPRFPAMSESLCKLYVPCGGEDRVDVIRIGSNKKIKEIPVGRDPSSCTLSIEEAKLYVTNFGDGTVSVIDTNTDTKIKDIPAPRVVIPGVSNAPLAQYPWNATISGSNGHLYVAYWGTAGDASPNGAIVEIDTCTDEVIRTIVDDSTQGIASNNTIAQRAFIPTSLPARNSAMAGAAAPDSGGPFGIDSSRPGIFFTNDGLGVVGMLDARIDQVVTPMPFGLASCQKPRGITSALVERTPFPNRTFDHLTYVACGQPDNEVLIIRTPALRENIPNVPVIDSIDYGSTIKITGKGFMPGARLEAIPDGSFACLTFKKEPKVKNDGTLVIQKGKLTNGRKLNPKRDERDEFISFRVINPDGTARIITVPPVRAIAVCPR